MRHQPILRATAVAALALSVSGAQVHADGRHGDTMRPIAPGVYHCKAGNTRLMLTLGDIAIDGANFRFTTPTGETSSGTYAAGPAGYTWTGRIGAIDASQIVDSGRNQDSDTSFWFSFKVRPTSLPTPASCS